MTKAGRIVARKMRSLARWLAIVAALAPLFLPVLPGAGGATASAATVSADLFAAELCSVAHGSRDDGQTPAHGQYQHCPLCRAFQQVGFCVAVQPVIAIVPVADVIEIVATNGFDPSWVRADHPGQPRAPPAGI